MSSRSSSSFFFQPGSSDYNDSAKNVVLRWLSDPPDFQRVQVEAWKGVGATALLRQVAEEVESNKHERYSFKFDVVIKLVRPAAFENPREIQRAVADQLLPRLLPPPPPPSPPTITTADADDRHRRVMAAFDREDEDDDFWPLAEKEFSEKGMLKEVAEMIYGAVKDRRVLLVLCNNLANGELIGTDELGIPILRVLRNAILWTSRTHIDRDRVPESIRPMKSVHISPPDEAAALNCVCMEAGEIARYINESGGGSLRTAPQIVLRCFWYYLLLRRAFDRSALHDRRPSEAAKYFACDGILEEDDDAAWEIGKALAPMIGPTANDEQLRYWEEAFSAWTPRASELPLLLPKTLLIDDIKHRDWVRLSSSSEEEESYRWISARFSRSNVPDPPKFFFRPIANDKKHRYWKETFFAPTSFTVLPPKISLIDDIKHRDWVRSSSSSEEEEINRWILALSSQSIVLKARKFFFEVCQSSVMRNASTLFCHFDEETHEALPNGFFRHFGNIRVLDLLGCAVSPINPFCLRLRNLRMLRLERCKVMIPEQSSVDPSTPSSAQEGRREPILFNRLWVLNLYDLDVYAFLLAGKAFELMPNLRELDLKDETSVLRPVASNELRERMHMLQILKLSGNINTNFLPKCLSMAFSLKEPTPNDCKELVSLPATNETIDQQTSESLGEVELGDPVATLPNLKTFHLSDSKLITKLSLQGCGKLENVDLQELTELKVLNLSGTALKVLDISKLPQLKQLFLLGCERLRRVLCEGPKLDALYLDNSSSVSTCNVDGCLDTFRNQRLDHLIDGTNDADQRLFQAYVVVRDVRIFRSLRHAFLDIGRAKTQIHIYIKSSSTIKKGIDIDTATKSYATVTLAFSYANVFDTTIDRRRRHYSSPPAMPLNNHTEFYGDIAYKIDDTTTIFANSLFIHDSTFDFDMHFKFGDLKCFRIERCPDIDFILRPWNWDDNNPVELLELESIWLSQLPGLNALCKRIRVRQLKHIYLEFCARLQYVLCSLSELHNLETIDIRYCGDLKAVFIDYDDNEDKRKATPKLLPNLRSIHLQELPKLQHIYESNIRAPVLQELKFRGCFNLRKLPLFDHRSMKAMKISCEKDWWDKLQWDGSESNHRSPLFNPKHCPYYKKPMKARWL